MLKFQDTRQHFESHTLSSSLLSIKTWEELSTILDHGHEKAGTDVYAMFIVSIYSMCIFETEVC